MSIEETSLIRSLVFSDIHTYGVDEDIFLKDLEMDLIF